MIVATEVNEHIRNNKWISKLVLVTFFLLVLLNLPGFCKAHSHDESPSFKYTKEANLMYQNAKHQHQHQHHHEPLHDDHHGHRQKPENPYDNVFLKAIGSTLIISTAPFLILYLVPLDNTKEREPLLKILLSFASGGLLGDAFLHLIPHALVPHSHDAEPIHSHSHDQPHTHDMTVGLCVLLGIIVFLIVEKAVRLIKTDHTHLHTHNIPDKSSKEKNEKDSDETKKESENDPKDQSDIKITGYLNLVADFLHNFTDGLAIGASYLAGNSIGIVTTFTILLHEVPHEVGDFAILVQSGYSKRKAMMLQLTTAVGALLGTLVSLLAEGMGDFATTWILPFTAGGFIYIATVSVIPELLTDSKFKQSVYEIIALLLGVYMMVLIGEFE